MPAGQLLAGRYRLESLLGSGGFGHTWLAADLEMDRQVAIKEFRLEKAGSWKAHDLFEREVRVLRNLRHPGVPTFYDVVRTDDGVAAWLVQELVPGRSLAQRLADGERFDAPAIRRIVAGALDVLDYLHALRPPVVHRDVKPGNLVIDDDLTLHLVDFGSVRDAVRGADSLASTVAGTYGYMAPEQLHGGATAASDLYGLGMTLAHLLTGRSPTALPRHGLALDMVSFEGVAEDLHMLVEGCTRPEPVDRLDIAAAREILEAPWELLADPAEPEPAEEELDAGSWREVLAHGARFAEPGPDGLVRLGLTGRVSIVAEANTVHLDLRPTAGDRRSAWAVASLLVAVLAVLLWQVVVLGLVAAFVLVPRIWRRLRLLRPIRLSFAGTSHWTLQGAKLGRTWSALPGKVRIYSSDQAVLQFGPEQWQVRLLDPDDIEAAAVAIRRIESGGWSEPNVEPRLEEVLPGRLRTRRAAPGSLRSVRTVEEERR